MNNIYQATQLIGDAYKEQSINQNEDILEWLIHKLKHSFGVAHDIMDILYGEREVYESLSPQERELVELSAILHDLGRFYQHANGRHLSNSEFDHGDFAVEKLKTHPVFSNPILLFAIGEHNKMSINFDNPYYTNLSEHDKKIAELTAKLLRDADKLENIKQFTFEGYPKLTYQIIKGPLSDYAKDCLAHDSQISNKATKNTTDRIAGILTWIFDVNFLTTKHIIKDLRFIENGIAKAKELGATDDDCELLAQHLSIK